MVALGLISCGPPIEFEGEEAEPVQLYTSLEQGLVTCGTRQDTGYRSGTAFTITVVTADGKPAEQETANAYAVMQQAAAADGVTLSVVSGFRTMAEQQYLYACYVNCSCNNCNLAAQPGYSNHQSGHALDLNTGAPGVLNWLNAHGPSFGFNRTVPSEDWHWEWWGGGPGGGPCGTTPDNCTQAEAEGCGAYGCGCVDHACNGIFCPGSGCSAQHATDCGGFGCGCADGQCNGGTCPGSGCTAKETLDCGRFGCGCVDHACNGGTACAGTGCTWRETHDCSQFGVNCVDHQCAGGFGPGSGCTAKESADCQAGGCGCVDHACSGGSCQGTGCTARQTLDCSSGDAGCALGLCVAPTEPVVVVTPVEDAGQPQAGDAGMAQVDAGVTEVEPLVPAVEPAPTQREELAPVRGGCSASPGVLVIGLLAWARRRRLAPSRVRGPETGLPDEAPDRGCVAQEHCREGRTTTQPDRSFDPGPKCDLQLDQCDCGGDDERHPIIGEEAERVVAELVHRRTASDVEPWSDSPMKQLKDGTHQRELEAELNPLEASPHRLHDLEHGRHLMVGSGQYFGVARKVATTWRPSAGYFRSRGCRSPPPR